MKIFAKRKRKAEGDVDPVINGIKTEPDPVVKEILQQDPSTWNAKQRRLVKRFEERTGKSVASLPETEATTESIESQINVATTSNETNVTQDVVDDPIDCVVVAEAKHDEHLLSSEDKDEDNIAAQPESDPHATDQEAPVQLQDRTTVVDAELQEILDQLNSKQRRTLVRQLERGGSLEEVRLEATRLLKEGEAKGLPPPVDSPAEPEPPLKKARTRRPVVDPTTLTPEERLRRDEQRRMQHAAAEARQKDLSTTTVQHKHPLNSERRRANRRKPKWEPKSLSHAVRQPNEHDSSGYHMRRITKAER